MPRSKDDFIQHWQYELASILFEGFVTKNTDPAMLYRMMITAHKRLRERLAQMHDEEMRVPPANNGKVTEQKKVGI